MNELMNITESGVPESRLNDPKSVKEMVLQMIQADDTRSGVRSKVKGLVDGNAPYKNSDLTRTAKPSEQT